MILRFSSQNTTQSAHCSGVKTYEWTWWANSCRDVRLLSSLPICPTGHSDRNLGFHLETTTFLGLSLQRYPPLLRDPSGAMTGLSQNSTTTGTVRQDGGMASHALVTFLCSLLLPLRNDIWSAEAAVAASIRRGRAHRETLVLMRPTNSL